MDEKVAIPVGDDVIAGVLHRARNGKGACVITCHGLSSNKDSKKYTGLAERCVAKGLDLLRFDFRGLGESTGRFEESMVTRRIEDLGHVMDFVDKDLGFRRLALFGSSLGGYVILLKAGPDTRVRALVCLATPYSMGQLVEKRMEKGGVHGTDDIGLGREFLQDLRSNDAFMLEELGGIGAPTLVVHGDRDETVPVDHAHYIFKRLRCEKRAEVVKGGDHVFSDPEHLDHVLSISTDWLVEHL